jgi:tRNA (adenine57-N1/adenine58-N1)-methyltransferase
MEHTVKPGDRVVLLGQDGSKVAVRIEPGARRVDGMGVVDPASLSGTVFGAITKIGNRRFIVLRPSLLDRIETLHRKAQIILPKDAAHIILDCDISAGKRVVEGGAGSGAMTTALASAVSPGGRVVTYDIRAEYLRQARHNIEQAGLDGVCEFREADITAPGAIAERDVDAVVLDIPEPWNAADNAWDALRPCGYLACYTPTVNQVEQSMRALRERRFIEVRAVEVLQREMIVVEKGIRPSFEMLGHSGYLTFARKVLEKFA